MTEPKVYRPMIPWCSKHNICFWDCDCTTDEHDIDKEMITFEEHKKIVEELNIENEKLDNEDNKKISGWMDTAVDSFKQSLTTKIEKPNGDISKWNKEHFITQKKGDDVIPTACSHCSGELIIIENGWTCKECLAPIDGKSFYQGRNSMRRDVLKAIKEASDE